MPTTESRKVTDRELSRIRADIERDIRLDLAQIAHYRAQLNKDRAQLATIKAAQKARKVKRK